MFRRLTKEAQDEFDYTPFGRYRNYLERTGLVPKDIIRSTLIDLFEDERRNRSSARYNKKDVALNIELTENDLTWLEHFKKFVRNNLFLLSGVAITVASAITAIILTTRQALKKGAKAIKKGKRTQR